MKQQNNDIALGRFISLVLRHDPTAAGIHLDENGWADVDALIGGINRTGRFINRKILERIVKENNKKRYSFNEEHTKIRANQGHSIAVDVELKTMVPPDINSGFQKMACGFAQRCRPHIYGKNKVKPFYKKESRLRDSPPAAGRPSDIIPISHHNNVM